MSKQTPLARRVIAAVLMVLLTACYNWEPTAVSPQTLIPAEHPSSVRVTLINGETVTVRDPTVRNDSILGATDAGRALTRRAVGVASRDVRLLEVQRLSVRKFVGIGLSVAPLVALWVFFISKRAQQRAIIP